MKGLKKHSLLLNIVCLVPLGLGLVAMASAQSQGVCSMNKLAGQFGYNATGSLVLQTGPELFASVGKLTLQSNGAVTSTQYASLGGDVSHETFEGTVTMNPDCTGTMTVELTDDSGNLPNRTVSWKVVFDDNAQEIRGLANSVVLHLPAGDVDTKAIVTFNGRKILPGNANAQ